MKFFFFFGEKRVNPEQYGLIYLQIEIGQPTHFIEKKR